MIILLGLSCFRSEPIDRDTLVAGCEELAVGTLAQDHPAVDDGFDRCVLALGVPSFALEGVSDESLLHVAIVTAEYLDNDEDGTADDPQLLDALLEARAVNFVLRDDGDEGRIARSSFARTVEGQPTWETEMDASVEPWFDATYEEVLHLINASGHTRAYPDTFSLEGDSALLTALDAADHFHYGDPTCDRACKAIEYLYWATTTNMGMQSDTQRCEVISIEWETCTPEQLAEQDPLMMAILESEDYPYPSIAPDGTYAP